MPYPNEHAARIIDPAKFEQDSFRRKNIADGIDIIVGKLIGEDTLTTQAYRFKKDKFTASEAKQWLADNNVEYISFEEASEPVNAVINLSGEVGNEINYTQVFGLVNGLGDFDTLTVNIDSYGGCSETGRKLYDYFKQLGKPITMRAVNNCMSAAFTIFCAGSTRIAEAIDTKFLMHAPWMVGFFMGGDDEAQWLLDEVKKEKQLLIDIYTKELGIEAATIEKLMDSDDVITAEAAKGLNMVTEIENMTKTVGVDTSMLDAKYKIAANYISDEFKQKLNKMENEKIKKQVEENNGILKRILNYFKGIVKALSVASEEGETIEIDGDNMVVGAVVTSETPDGTYTVMIEEKKYKVTIENKVVTVVEEVEIEETPIDDTQALKDENAKLKQEIEDLKTKLEAKSELEAKYAENQALIDQLKNVHSKHFNPETNTFDFSTNIEPNEKKAKKKTEAEIKAAVEEAKNQYKIKK